MTTNLSIPLTPAQAAGLRARCSEFGVSPQELIGRFIADLTSTAGNGGSDEQDRAADWANRSLTFGVPPKSERALQRSWRFQTQAFQACALDRAELTAHRSAGGGR